MSAMVQGVLGGAASGVLVAVGGYLKNAGTDFSWSNFGQTVVEGVIVGGVGGALGVSYAAAQDYLVSVGAVTLIDYVKKIIVRRVWPWLKKKFQSLTG